jgi:putative ATPase
MSPEAFYEPTDRGFEARVRERLAFWAEKRREKQNRPDEE